MPLLDDVAHGQYRELKRAGRKAGRQAGRHLHVWCPCQILAHSNDRKVAVGALAL